MTLESQQLLEANSIFSEFPRREVLHDEQRDLYLKIPREGGPSSTLAQQKRLKIPDWIITSFTFMVNEIISL